MIYAACFFVPYLPEHLVDELGCYGRPMRCHIISKQRIKARFKTLIRAGDATASDLVRALDDARNEVKGCWRHHQLFDNARFRVPREALPDGIEEFAEPLGLAWSIDPTHPRSVVLGV